LGRLDARYVATSRGPLFLVTLTPVQGPVRGSVLVVPPFAEELNKCRRMVALVARRLAGAGWHVAVPDLTGTGDSPVAFGQASVAAWLDDIVDAAAEAGLRAPVRAVLGVRLGASLATSVLDRLPDVTQFIAWQPVVSGQQHLTQFLRLRVAGSALSGQGGVTAAALRAGLLSGSPVEVAGYELTPVLAAGLDALRFELPRSGRLPSLHWMEVSAATPPVPGPVAARHVGQWMEQGGNADASAFNGEPFWSTVEIGVSVPMLDATVSSLCPPVAA
jgi:exosortase A-associated hydrolase 2